MKTVLSYILPLSLIAAMAALGLLKIAYHRQIWNGRIFNPDMVMAALYILWMTYEMKISHHDAMEKTPDSDRGTREFYAISQGLTAASAFLLEPLWKEPGIGHAAGFLLFMAGTGLRLRAIRALGDFYSHNARKSDDHVIITSGPYRIIRHPAYCGMIIAHMGLAVFYFNLITTVLLFLLLIPSIITRITVEEKILGDISGYETYSRKKKRLIPFVW
jgi:protein-S-isoprenylcysteine O-methyltransferase Ste14